MFPLSSYRDLIDLSPPASQPPPNIPHPDILALAFLYAEHAESEENVDAPSEVRARRGGTEGGWSRNQGLS